MKFDWNEERVVAFREQINNILWNIWDPIGVNHEPGAFGEYDSYGIDILIMLFEKDISMKQLDEYLTWASHTNMGLPLICEHQQTCREITCQKIFEVWNKFRENLALMK